MKVRIKTFAQIKDILGADSFLEYPDATSMRELLISLRKKAGESEDQLFSSEGELHSHLVLMMNGRRIYKEDIESITLPEGDGIVLFYLVS
jgi:molybdopterin synthase sulfur carrier subunit